ncbi:MliC family protein [Mixta intestinalis]|nr:MliC family protein [Mixta intestinalis]
MRKTSVLLAMVLLSGCGLNSGQRNTVKVQHYLCGTLPLTIALSEQQAQFIMDGQPLTLQRQPSSSDTLYANDSWRLRMEGTSASIERNRRIIVADCQQQTQG